MTEIPPHVLSAAEVLARNVCEEMQAGPLTPAIPPDAEKQFVFLWREHLAEEPRVQEFFYRLGMHSVELPELFPATRRQIGLRLASAIQQLSAVRERRGAMGIELPEEDLDAELVISFLASHWGNPDFARTELRRVVGLEE